MERKGSVGKIGCVVLLSLFLFSVCQASIITTENSIGGSPSDWVLLFYLNGDNALSTAQGQVMENIRQAGSSLQVNVAILIDQNQAADTRLYYLNGTSLVQQSWPTESSMDDPATIVQFVTKVKNEIPANHYALFISSNKGSGWQGICWDDHGDGVMITMPELLQALNTITNNGTDKLDVLGIETCMTGNMEVAYQINTCIDFFVAYPECAMLFEWPYVPSLTDLKNNPAMTPQEFAIDIVSHFVPHNYPQDRMKTTMAATNLSYLSSISLSINDLAVFFLDHLEQYKTQITTGVETARVYARLWYIDYYIDFYDFLDLCPINDPEFTTIKNIIQSTMDTAVIANSHLPDDPAHGLSIYFPRRAGDYNDSLRYEELPSPYEATNFAINTHWDEFLQTYLGIFNNTQPVKPSITGEVKGKKGETYEYTVTSTDPEGQDVFYYIDWGDGNNTGWMGPFASGTDVIINHSWSKRGTYVIRAKAKDVLDAESEWATLTVKMPMFNRWTAPTSKIILFGLISGIETNEFGAFRFQPARVLEINRVVGQNHTIKILRAVDGEYPCCGYISPDEFNGILRSRFIIGAWIIPV